VASKDDGRGAKREFTTAPIQYRHKPWHI